MTKFVGILTAGGDSPGLNAAIRGFGKAACGAYGMRMVGFRDGFRGLMENRIERFDSSDFAGLLTVGGTVLGTSRERPYRMQVAGKTVDMTELIVENYNRHALDALVCLGGGGTLKSAAHLLKQGLNVITLPKTIDNDIEGTDVSFGFDTALSIATEAIDRLHSTAHSHHRIIVVEVMGHNAGWLALGAGLAGGADVILIPEIPYDIERIAAAIRRRSSHGRAFSIVAVAEGARTKDEARAWEAARLRKKSAGNAKERQAAITALAALEREHADNASSLARELEKLTNLEARLTILGHVQRGGKPSAVDRVLATKLGTAGASLVHEGRAGVMVAARDGKCVPVPIEEVVGRRRVVPLDHPWLESARLTGVCLGES